MKPFLFCVISALCLLPYSVFAERCPTVEIAGIHIGMTHDEFKREYRGCYQQNDTLSITAIDLVIYSTCALSGIPDGWYLDFARFYQGKLTYFVMNHLGGWSADTYSPEHYQKIVSRLGLPEEGWQPDRYESGDPQFDREFMQISQAEFNDGVEAHFFCDSIDIEVDTGVRGQRADLPRVSVMDNDSDPPDELVRAARERKWEKGITVTRFYTRAEGYVVAVVETDKPVDVKCVVKGQDGSSVAVETQRVEPPADEVLIYVGQADASSISCAAR